MAGVKGRSGSGGARPGAGGPKKDRTVSDVVKAGILKAAKRLKKKYKIPIEEAMLELVYDKKTQAAVKASVFKVYIDALVAKESDKNVNFTGAQAPAISLPPRREDPALKVHEGGKE